MLFKFVYFGELTKGLQICNALDCVGQVLQRDKNPISFTSLILFNAPFVICSESNFTEVCLRHPKSHYDLIMTSFHNLSFLKLHIL